MQVVLLPSAPPHEAGTGRARGAVVALAVGKPPRPGTLVAEVAGLLRARGVRVDVLLPHGDPDVLARTAREAGPPDLLVHRGLRPEALTAVAAVQAGGVPCCNPATAVSLVGDRTRTTAALSAVGVPVPASRRVERWPEVRSALATGPRVVKRADDATGRARGVALLRDGGSAPPFPGPWLVQQPVGGDGVDRKLYVAGDRVAGRLKPGPLLGPGGPAHPFEPDPGLCALARQVGEVLGLHVFGVDVLVGADGPVVVDVNAMPGFRGVAGAARHVAEHLLVDHLDHDVRDTSLASPARPTVGG